MSIIDEACLPRNAGEQQASLREFNNSLLAGPVCIDQAIYTQYVRASFSFHDYYIGLFYTTIDCLDPRFQQSYINILY